MSEYKFNYDEKEYILNEDNCSGLLNDEEKPVKNINLSNIIELLKQNDNDFDVEYYQEACPECLAGVKEKEKKKGTILSFFPSAIKLPCSLPVCPEKTDIQNAIGEKDCIICPSC